MAIFGQDSTMYLSQHDAGEEQNGSKALQKTFSSQSIPTQEGVTG